MIPPSISQRVPLQVEANRMLETKNLKITYGAITAVQDLSISVPKGGIVTLIGANGAGKSTTLRAISGIIRAASGAIIFDGEDITRMLPHKIVERGLSHVPEGRMIFPNLTVRENLEMGAYRRKDRKSFPKDFDYIFSIFPRLKERERQIAGTLSGGEQQMLAIGRALMSKPKCLMLDEPSLGIAPILVRTIFEKIGEINRELGLTVLLVEQNANLALKVSQSGYVLETGNVILHDTSQALRENSKVRESYLGG